MLEQRHSHSNVYGFIAATEQNHCDPGSHKARKIGDPIHAQRMAVECKRPMSRESVVVKRGNTIIDVCCSETRIPQLHQAQRTRESPGTEDLDLAGVELSVLKDRSVPATKQLRSIAQYSLGERSRQIEGRVEHAELPRWRIESVLGASSESQFPPAAAGTISGPKAKQLVRQYPDETPCKTIETIWRRRQPAPSHESTSALFAPRPDPCGANRRGTIAGAQRLDRCTAGKRRLRLHEEPISGPRFQFGQGRQHFGERVAGNGVVELPFGISQTPLAKLERQDQPGPSSRMNGLPRHAQSFRR